MLPLNVFRLDFIATNAMSKEEFQKLIAPGLTCLDSYIQAFDSKQSVKVSLFEPHHDVLKNEQWFARCVLNLSVGRQRIPHLHHLFEMTVHYIGCIVDPVIEIEDEVMAFEFER